MISKFRAIENMDVKELGRCGVKVPAIGMGTWGIGGYTTRDTTHDKEAIVALRKGIELGLYLIDTAEMYGNGHCEEIVGEAIKPFPREQVFIVSKVLPEHLCYNDVIKAARGSLKRLKTNFIDLYLIHSPNSRVPLKETMGAMEKLVGDGLVRFIGVSNFDVTEMEEARNYLSTNDIVVNQVEYSLLERSIERDVLPYCIKNQITVMAYTPLAKGELARNKFLREIGEKYGKNPAQVALNWLISKENVIAIPKAINLRHVEENVGAMGWRLSKSDVESISSYFK
ncbi:MAG: aldo/keto reductase [Candidatus Aenigmarchaeota archaeon]|nr:aldo/keto reductase [Candidatus Aenigmarchaeota archaeon]